MIKTVIALLLAYPFFTFGSQALALEKKEMVALLEILDDRQRNSGDSKTLVYIERKEKDKNDVVYQAVVYRRDQEEKLIILFVKPKAEAGKGYLRIGKNMFLYDPTVGKWERRTERERIGGTDSRRADFDAPSLAQEFTPAYEGQEKLGRFTVHHLKLTANKGVDVAFPIVHLWLDVDTNNILKRQEYSLSGRLMRTAYYPKWEKVYSQSKGSDLYIPKQIRIFDEVEKGNRTIIVLQKVDLALLPANIFTKAWLESKSR